MALRQDPSVVMMIKRRRRKLTQVLLRKKVYMEKLLGWVKSMETESPDVLINLKQVNLVPAVELPVQRFRSSLTSIKVLIVFMKKT